MTRYLPVLAAVGLFLVTGCSSIVDGTTQEIQVVTSPPGATCTLERGAVVIGRIAATPGMAKVDKDKHDITIACDKSGYARATYVDKSDVAGATLGNIAAGGLVGWAVDSATGADNKYESPVNITLPSR